MQQEVSGRAEPCIALCVVCFVVTLEFRMFVYEYRWLLWVGMGVTLVVILPMACVKTLRV